MGIFTYFEDYIHMYKNAYYNIIYIIRIKHWKQYKSLKIWVDLINYSNVME